MTHTVTLTNPQQAHDILTRAGQWIKEIGRAHV
jgi:hypothetical protein